MDRMVIFRDNQELQADDLNNVQEYMQAAFDRLISDAVGAGRYFTGFDITVPSSGSWEVSLAPGRLYALGSMYREANITTHDLFNHRPVSQKKIVAITTWADTVETDVQPRDFLIDVDTGESQPEAVAMQRLRQARIGIVAGAEGPQPTAPEVASSNVVVALVTIGTGGIENVELQTGNRLPQVFQNFQRLLEFAIWREAVGTAIDTIRTDLASIWERFASVALDSRVGWLEDELRAVRALAEAAARGADWLVDDVDSFDNLERTDGAAPGYSAVVADGALQFPNAADQTVTGGIDLLIPSDPKASVAGGVLLPAHTSFLRLDGYGTQAGVAEMLAYSTGTHTIKVQSQPRTITYYSQADTIHRSYKGVPGVVFHAQSFKWPSSIQVGAKTYVYNSLSVNNPTDGEFTLEYCLEVTQKVVDEKVETVDTNHTGQGRAQVFFNPNAGWLTRIGFRVAEKAATGDVRVLVAEADGDVPNIARTIADVTVPLVDVVVGDNTAAIGPVYLAPGKRFAVVLMSAGNHKLALSADKANAFLGQQFALSAANTWVRPASQDSLSLAVRLYFARFASNRVEIDLKPLELAGGIDAVTIDAARFVPAGTKLAFEVRTGDTWYALEGTNGQRPAFDFSGTPNLLALRAVFIGTTELMPAFSIGNARSSLKAHRRGGGLKHVATAIDVGSGKTATKATMRLRVENWNPAHTLTPSLIVNSAPVAAASVEDTILPNGVLVRTARFTFSANRYLTPVIDGVRDAGRAHYMVLERHVSAYE